MSPAHQAGLQTGKDKLKQLQDLLAHQIQNSDPAPIIERALDALLTQVLEKKAAITAKPRASRAVTGRPRWVRTIPAALRRLVWMRDDGRCTFVGAGGHRCDETRCVEFADLEPWAKGGEHSEHNITLRCRAHNAFEADRDYGTSYMASKRNRSVATKPLTVREPIARYIVRYVSGSAARNRSNEFATYEISSGSRVFAMTWPAAPRGAGARFAMTLGW